jgi:hypothetical protein
VATSLDEEILVGTARIVPEHDRSGRAFLNGRAAGIGQPEDARLCPAQLQLVPHVEMHGHLIVGGETVSAHQREHDVPLARVVHIDRAERVGKLVRDLIERRHRTRPGDVHADRLVDRNGQSRQVHGEGDRIVVTVGGLQIVDVLE